MSVDQSLRKILDTRVEKNTLRSLKVVKSDMVDFSSNDYLGLAKTNEIPTQSLASGTGGSRLLNGNHSFHEELEQYLAAFLHSQAFLLFNSGYVANIGLLSCVPQKGDVILMDEYAHICIKEGARLSRAKYFNFRHNDLEDLERKLKRLEANHIFIVVESIYSMDGDACPLKDLIALAKRYKAEVIVDEAHSTALYPNGIGYCVDQGLEKEVYARVYTFGKAVGAHGAGVAGSATLIAYLINYSRSFIYTTSLPEHSIIAVKQAFEKIRSDSASAAWHGLLSKIKLFRTHIAKGISKLGGEHPIQGIVCNAPEKAKALAEYLQERQFDVRPIYSPTVPEGLERVRICIHLYNSDKEILSLASAINTFFQNHN